VRLGGRHLGGVALDGGPVDVLHRRAVGVLGAVQGAGDPGGVVEHHDVLAGDTVGDTLRHTLGAGDADADAFVRHRLRADGAQRGQGGQSHGDDGTQYWPAHAASSLSEHTSVR
jgi:hypothetical protein